MIVVLAAFLIWLIPAVRIGIGLGKHLAETEAINELPAMVIYAVFWPISGPTYWAFNRKWRKLHSKEVKP